MRQILFIVLSVVAALAAEAAELPVAVTRGRVAEVVDRVRQDAHADVSFIEGDPSSTVIVDGTSVDEILTSIARQVPSYRFEVIEGHRFLYDGDARWRQTIENVDLRGVAREGALSDYVSLLRRRPEFAKLIPPGYVGHGEQRVANDPMLQRVTLDRSATVVRHLAQLLGDSHRLIIDVRKFHWGKEIADGVTFDGIEPLAFDPPVYGESPSAPRWPFALGSYNTAILQQNGFDKLGVETFVKALGHPFPAVREAGIERLGLTPRSAPQFKAAVRKLLNDPSLAVRLRAAEALLQAGETTGYSVVKSAARDAKDPNVRLSGVAGLAKFRMDRRPETHP